MGGPEAPAAVANTVKGPRVAAFLIDSLVLVVLFVVMALLFGDSDASGSGASVNLSGGPLVLYLVITILYFAIPEGLTGASLGKRVLGLRVTRDDGSPVGIGRALGRNVLRFIDALPLFYLLGLILILARDDAKRVGDMAAGTIVRRSAGGRAA